MFVRYFPYLVSLNFIIMKFDCFIVNSGIIKNKKCHLGTIPFKLKKSICHLVTTSFHWSLYLNKNLIISGARLRHQEFGFSPISSFQLVFRTWSNSNFRVSDFGTDFRRSSSFWIDIWRSSIWGLSRIGRLHGTRTDRRCHQRKHAGVFAAGCTTTSKFLNYF